MRRRLDVAAIAVLILGVSATPALAVIPSAIGPMQALIAILPQLLVVLSAALLAVLKPKTYKALLRYCWSHKALTAGLCAPVLVLVWVGFIRGEIAGQAQQGVPWVGFRGGIERTGAVPNSTGPFQSPKILKAFMPDGVGVVSIDSSPAVVGNRVYFTVSAQSPFKKSGAIYCLDTDTSGLVWKYTGDDTDRPVEPIFSSPAIGGGPPGHEARYLVCGEGYHVEQDSRLICLDLESLDASGKPKLKWTIPSTNHVESSPCIFEGKVYVGSGDDGYWCVELATGRILFHIESDAAYEINEGAQVEALSKLAGKTVMVHGPVKRWRPVEGKDESVMFLDALEFHEVPEGTTLYPAPPKNADNTLRNIIGKVVVNASPEHKAQGGSRVKIEISTFYPDAESPPIAARINGEPRVFFGSGIGGQAVVCAHAETGKEIWKAKTAFPAFSAPTIAGDKILVGLSNGTFVASDPNPAGSVLCFSAIDGKPLWECKASDGIVGAVAVRDGFAYACSRDGNLYVINIADGKTAKKYSTGGAMVCSPAVTEKGVFMCNELGKLYCVKRASNEYQWSCTLTPGQTILSSPTVAGNKLFVGSMSRGLFCVTENPDGVSAVQKAAPWSGQGGNAGRCGYVDGNGPPGVKTGTKAERVSDAGKIQSRTSGGPLATCGKFIYAPAVQSAEVQKPLLACVNTTERREVWQASVSGPIGALSADENLIYAWCESGDAATLNALSAAKKGEVAWTLNLPRVDQPMLCLAGTRLVVKSGPRTLSALDAATHAELWKKDIDTLAGAPAAAHGLLFLAVSAPKPQLICIDDASGQTIWTIDLPAKPLGPPTLSGDKLFVGIAGKEAEGKVLCRHLTDGSAAWECDVDQAPASYLVASGDYLAFTVADGTVFVLNTIKGEQTHTVLLGKGGQAPVIVQNLLLLGADNRVGGYDLSASVWVWGFSEQKNVGRVLSAPILAGEALWLSTEKMGLIAVGAKDAEPKP